MLAGSIFLSIWKVWIEARKRDLLPFGALPAWPLSPEQQAPEIVIGEVHHPVEAREIFNPEWLTVPERGLYTSIAIFGAVGSGKTSACMHPFAKQLCTVARHPLQVVARHPLQCDKVRRISEGRFCMPWKRVDVMEERVRFVARALAPDRNMSELCRQFGISRPTGYQWVGRYQEGGSFAKLSEHSRRPHRSPRQTPEAVEERVVELRRRYG